jgi:hypothetical protein
MFLCRRFATGWHFGTLNSCPKTSINCCQVWPCNILEQWRPQVQLYNHCQDNLKVSCVGEHAVWKHMFPNECKEICMKNTEWYSSNIIKMLGSEVALTLTAYKIKQNSRQCRERSIFQVTETVKLYLYTPWSNMGSRGIVASIFKVDVRWRQVVRYTPHTCCCTASKTAPVPIKQEAWWPPLGDEKYHPSPTGN